MESVFGALRKQSRAELKAIAAKGAMTMAEGGQSLGLTQAKKAARIGGCWRCERCVSSRLVTGAGPRRWSVAGNASVVRP